MPVGYLAWWMANSGRIGQIWMLKPRGSRHGNKGVPVPQYTSAGGTETQTSEGCEPRVSLLPNSWLHFKAPWFSDSVLIHQAPTTWISVSLLHSVQLVEDLNRTTGPSKDDPSGLTALSWGISLSCLWTHTDASDPLGLGGLAFRLENIPPACCRRLSGGHGCCHLTPELSPGQSEAPHSPSPWNVFVPTIPPGDHFQGHSLERDMCCWDQMNWLCDPAQSRLLYKLEILGSRCRELLILQGPKMSRTSKFPACQTCPLPIWSDLPHSPFSAWPFGGHSASQHCWPASLALAPGLTLALHQQLSWVSSWPTEHRGISQPPESCEPIPYHKSLSLSTPPAAVSLQNRDSSHPSWRVWPPMIPPSWKSGSKLLYPPKKVLCQGKNLTKRWHFLDYWFSKSTLIFLVWYSQHFEVFLCISLNF